MATRFTLLASFTLRSSMRNFRSLLFALVVAAALTAVSLDEASGVSEDVFARTAAVAEGGIAFQSHRLGRTVRSIILSPRKRLKMKRQKQSQQEAATHHKDEDNKFAKQNSAGQKAANAKPYADRESSDHGNKNFAAVADSTPPSQAVVSKQHSATGRHKKNMIVAKSNQKCSAKKQGSWSAFSSTSPASLTSVQRRSSNGCRGKSAGSYSSNTSFSSSTSSTASASPSSSGLSGVLDLVTDGHATYYATGLGACGWINFDSEYIVALPVGILDRLGGTVSNGSVVCSKKIKIANSSGTIVITTVADRCTSCADDHLDLSPSAFSALGNKDNGVIKISWGWIGSVPGQ